MPLPVSLLDVVQRLLLLATDPEMMEQHSKLACHGDDRPSLSSLAPTFSPLQSPSAQIGVLPEWAQDVLCPLDLLGSRFRRLHEYLK